MIPEERVKKILNEASMIDEENRQRFLAFIADQIREAEKEGFDKGYAQYKGDHTAYEIGIKEGRASMREEAAKKIEWHGCEEDRCMRRGEHDPHFCPRALGEEIRSIEI